MPTNENTLPCNLISKIRAKKEIKPPHSDIEREIGFPENKNTVNIRISVTEKATLFPYKYAAMIIMMFEMPSFTPGTGIKNCKGKKPSSMPHKAAITE